MIGVYYKSKAEMKKAVGKPLSYVETSMFKAELVAGGSATFVGPDPYRNRKFFGTVTVDTNFNIVKVV